MHKKMSDDEQRRLVETMTRVSDEIRRNTRPSDPQRWLLACNRKTWAEFGFAPEDYDEWCNTGVIPLRSVSLARERIRSKNVSPGT